MKTTPKIAALAVLLMLLTVAGAMATGVGATSGDAVAQINTPTPTETPVPATNTPAPTLPPAIPDGALTGTVIRATTLLVREAPYLGADVIGRVRRGETYAVIGRDPDARWYRIQTFNGPGWVWGHYLFVDGNEFNAAETNPFANFGDPSDNAAYVVQTNAVLKLRAQPNIGAEQIGRVGWGETLPVIGRARVGSWYQVVYEGTVGWVFSPYTNGIEGDLNAVPYVEADSFPPPAADVPADSNVEVIVVTNTPVPSSTPIVIIVTATPSPMP